MLSRYRIWFMSLTVALVAAMAFAGAAECAKTVKKPAPKPSKAAPSSTMGPKIVRVVAVRGFEEVPASGSSKISIVMCPEETSPATFTVRSSKALPGVKMAPAGNLTGPSVVSSSNIEISRLDGEQLISDTTSDLGTQPVQFWVDVTIPRGAKPGVYTGAIALYQQNKKIDSVPIEVKVLPLRLLGSSRQFGLYTLYGPGNSPSHMDPAAFKQFAQAVERIQFKFTSVDADPTNAQQVMSSYTAAGLSGPVDVTTYAFDATAPSYDQVIAIDTARKAAGLNSAFYFAVDSPSTPEQIAAAQQQIDVFRSARLQSAVRITDESVLSQLKNVDAVDYPFTSQYVQSMMNGQGKRTTMWEWFWWDARKSVMDNRLYSGIGLWKSGLYGVLPVWQMPEAGARPDEGLTSLLGEALREGVTDTRYITSYMKALRELKDLKRAKDKDYIAETETYLAKFMARPLDSIKPADIYQFREKMAAYSIKLAAML